MFPYMQKYKGCRKKSVHRTAVNASYLTDYLQNAQCFRLAIISRRGRYLLSPTAAALTAFFPDSPEKKEGGEGVCVYNNEEIAPINNWCNKSVGNVAH